MFEIVEDTSVAAAIDSSQAIITNAAVVVHRVLAEPNEGGLSKCLQHLSISGSNGDLRDQRNESVAWETWLTWLTWVTWSTWETSCTAE
jgi:hypothetical protein